LEAELDVWAGWAGALEEARASLEEFREESDDAYRQAAATLPSDPPSIFSQILDAILRLPET
jgi:hypothetical protein